jgi:uncharacterized protein
VYQTPLIDLARVSAVCPQTVSLPDLPVCDWSVHGETRGSDSRQTGWMHLQASLNLPQICQRCLEPMNVPLEVDRWFRFVADEATALAQDDGCEEDLLVASGEFNGLELLEDELLMAVPLIISHGDCQPPASSALVDDLPHPFAALAGLKSAKP